MQTFFAFLHKVAAGIASPNVTVTAVDLLNGSFTADPQPVTVTPVAPANVSASHSGSSIAVGWTNASNISTGTTILLSTDDVAFFEAGGAATGATGTTISNLNLDTNYWVEALTEGANGESTTTTPLEVSTSYSAPSLVIIPSIASPLQGQGFSLNLSATYPDNTPQKDLVATWTVDWGDGGPAQNYSGQAVTASAPTYAAGTLSANISVTATDGNGHSVTQSQTLCFSPYGVTNGIFGGVYNTDATSAVITWSGPASTIASEYIIQRISPGEEADGWQTIGYRLVSDNVSSDEDGLNYTYTDSNLSPSSIGGDGGYLYRIGAKTSDATSDAPDSPGVAGYTVATNLLQTPLPSGPGTVSGTDTSIVAGGEVDVVLSYSLYSGANPAGTVLTVKNFNPDVVQPTITTVTINSSGGAILPVAGLSVGSGKIIVQDSAGDEVTLRCGVYAVGVSSTGNVVQGATYGTSNMPGFTFFIDGPSVTPVVISYNTSGGTLPSDLMGNMSSGSVTIPAGEQSVFVPFTVPDDGKIAPTRTVVVTLSTSAGGDQAYMHVFNNDAPGITIDGESSGSDVSVDDQDTTSLLAPVAFSVQTDCSLDSETFTWDPNEDVIWLTDQVGDAGVGNGNSDGNDEDLANMSGVTSEDGVDSYTWTGFVPTKLYAQAIGGSSAINGTQMSIVAAVTLTATPFVAPASAAPSYAAQATQNGLIINVSAAQMFSDPGGETIGIIGQTQVGDLITLSAQWLGPNPGLTTASLSDINWSIPGAGSDPATATAIAGYDPTKTSYQQVTCLTAANLQSATVSFYFLPTGSPTGARAASISLNASYGGTGRHVQAKILIWEPKFTPDDPANNSIGTSVGTYWNGAGEDLRMLDSANTPAETIFGGTVATPLPSLFATGQWHYTQIIHYIFDVTQSDNSKHEATQNSGEGHNLDNGYLFAKGVVNGTALTWIPADGISNAIFIDAPHVSWKPAYHITAATYIFAAQTFAMYNPETQGSIDVGVKVRNWAFKIVVSSPTGAKDSYSVSVTVGPKLSQWEPGIQPEWEATTVNESPITYTPPLN